MEDRRLPHYLPGVKTGARVGNLKLDLPVDEDDYLMPSPQSTQPHHHAGYMDLIGDAKLGGKKNSCPANLKIHFRPFLKNSKFLNEIFLERFYRQW